MKKIKFELVEDGVADYELIDEEMNKMLSVADAAKTLGVSKATVRKMSDARKLKTFRIGQGKHRRFRMKDVLDLLKAD